MALPEIDPSRRIVPRTRGDLRHPGSCACCGGDNPEITYVDFGIYFDYEGTMYICETCFREAVQVMGFFTPEEVADQLAQLNSLIEQNAALTSELNNARPILDSVLSLAGNSGALSAAITSEFANLDDSESEGGSPTADEDAVSGESSAEELTVSERRSDTGGTELRERSEPVIV